jgi:hypothetical protein
MMNEISYVHPVRNSSLAIAGLETLRGIISNGIKRKYPILFLLLLLQFLL